MKSALGWAAFLAVVVVAMKQQKPVPAPTTQRAQMIDLITREARAQGFDPVAALAFADVESGLNPAAKGDLSWSDRDGGERYRRLVLDNPRLTDNPARTTPAAWHSYGLFQLLAAHHVGPTEHPNVLYDPQVNATRAIALLRGLSRTYGGDLAEVRLAYTGARAASAATQEAILTRFAQVYERWAEMRS